MTELSRRGPALLPAGAMFSLAIPEPRAEPAERTAAAAPIARVIQQTGKAEDFGIRSQTAATARSTDWIVEAQPSETKVFVVSGVVSVADPAQGASVRRLAGKGTSVAGSAAEGPAAPKIRGAKRAADALART